MTPPKKNPPKTGKQSRFNSAMTMVGKAAFAAQFFNHQAPKVIQTEKKRRKKKKKKNNCWFHLHTTEVLLKSLKSSDR